MRACTQHTGERKAHNRTLQRLEFPTADQYKFNAQVVPAEFALAVHTADSLTAERGTSAGEMGVPLEHAPALLQDAVQHGV